MPTVYVKRVPSSEWSRTVWDTNTTYNVGDRVSYDDGIDNRYYECIQSHSSSIPQTNGDTYWVRIGSSPEFPYHATDGRLDNHNSGDVYLETVNLRYTGSAGMIWNHATESGSTPGEIILEDGEYFQPSSALCADGIDITAANIGKVTINHFYFNTQYIIQKGQFTTHLSKITGINLIMGGGGNSLLSTSGSQLFFDQCKLTDENCPYGVVDSSDFRIGNQNHWTFKNSLLYFPNATASLFANNMLQYEGKSPVWENSTFALGFGSGNNYSPLFYSSHYSTKSPYVKNCIFYATHLGYTSSGPIAISNSNNSIGESNIVYSSSDAITFTENDSFKYLDPQFVDPSKGNFSLRPSSPLIGGITTGNVLSQKHPSGVWVDHNHTPVQVSYSYNLDSGDGTNYSFSGDATGSDPELTVNTRDTLTFTNNTGGHPLAIYNNQGIQVASEASGTTTFTPKYPDTYYYQCTAPGHENMRGDIVVTLGTLGSYEHPFESYHDAIDSGYYNSKMTLLFKEGDHLMSWYPGTNYANNTGISSSFPGGLSFVGEDSETTRFTTGNNFNTYTAFYVGASLFSGSSQSQTPLTIEGMGFYINNTSSYLNRGLFSGVHWKSFTLKRSKVTCDLGGATNSGLFDYFSSVAPAGYEFNLSGCEMNVPISDNNGPGGTFLSGSTNIKYTVNSCSFTKLDGYNYVHNGPSPIMIGGAFSSSNGSEIKNCIFYSNAGGDFSSSSVIASGVFSSCIFYSATDSFTNLPPDMDVNSAADPLFINTLAGSEDLRSRPDSSAIGGIFKSKYPADTIWVQSGTGSGTGTEGDPFYWSEYSEAFLAAVQSSSNQIVFKDGQYVWTSAILQDDNVGNNITMIAENTHQAIFTDAGRISSDTKNPTLRFKGIQLVANDHFTWKQECHYIFDSVHVLAGKYIGARSVTASGCIFEVPSGVNAYMFSSTGLVDITNCIFVDHNDRTSGVNYLTGATTGTIKNTIFYTKNPRTYCINPSHNAVLTNCASENITNPEDGVVFNENLGFLDIDNKNYNLRPASPLIGRG